MSSLGGGSSFSQSKNILDTINLDYVDSVKYIQVVVCNIIPINSYNSILIEEVTYDAIDVLQQVTKRDELRTF